MNDSSKFTKTDFQACLLEGAIGDVLGAPVEFWSIEQIRQRYGESGLKDFTEFKDGTGRFTDDTQMTLFTAEVFSDLDIELCFTE